MVKFRREKAVARPGLFPSVGRGRCLYSTFTGIRYLLYQKIHSQDDRYHGDDHGQTMESARPVLQYGRPPGFGLKERVDEWSRPSPTRQQESPHEEKSQQDGQEPPLFVFFEKNPELLKEPTSGRGGLLFEFCRFLLIH